MVLGYLAEIVNALAPGLKMASIISISRTVDIEVMFETSNVAISSGYSGTVFGVQLVTMCQLPLAGLRFHVALAAEPILEVRRTEAKRRIWSGFTLVL